MRRYCIFTAQTSNLVLWFLKDTLKRGYIAKNARPPSSPDTNPLDRWFRDAVKWKVYDVRAGRPFDNEQGLKNTMKRVWSSVVSDKKTIWKAIKQFVPRLREVARKGGYSIKLTFGWRLPVHLMIFMDFHFSCYNSVLYVIICHLVFQRKWCYLYTQRSSNRKRKHTKLVCLSDVSFRTNWKSHFLQGRSSCLKTKEIA